MLRPATIALWLACALAPMTAEAETLTIIVKEGDALSLIAARTGASVEELKRWNRLRSDFIRAGQTLVVHQKEPSTGHSETAEGDGIDWTPPFDYGDTPEPTPERHSPPIAASEAAVAVATTRQPRQPKMGRAYTVKRGDTLTGIATRHRTTVDQLLKINRGLDPDRIYPGQTIGIGTPIPEVRFRLERGDTLAAVSRRYGVTSKDLARWNKGIVGRRVEPGTQLRVYTRVPLSPSEAIGPTNRGRLEHAVQLPSHPGYVIRARSRAYGTEETTRWIVDAFDRVDARFKKRKVVRVHDISDRDGGPIRDHKSHQNGRDADISYYQAKCPRSGCAFSKVKPSQLDVARQWTLLEYWLRNGQAEMIFIDYRLQAKLYRYAKKRGVPEAQLRRWMQYPRGKYEPVGVIRHFRNHEDHLHVRFACPYSDTKCRR